MTRTIINIRREDYGLRLSLFLHQRLANGRIAIPAAPLTIRTLSEDESSGTVAIEPQVPLFHFSEDDAKHLMDELWNLGIRPTEGHGSTGQLAATEKHLNDSRQMLQQCLDTILLKAQQ